MVTSSYSDGRLYPSSSSPRFRVSCASVEDGEDGVHNGLLLFLVTLTSALVPRSDASYQPLLGLRADSFIDPICVAACDGTTCGSQTCGVQTSALSARSLVTRDDLESNPLFRSKVLRNDHDYTRVEPLAKRAFGYKPGDRSSVKTEPPTAEEADTYIRGVLLSLEDDYFGEATALTLENTNAARSHQVEFGDKAFQITSDGLHGCTVVTVTSKKAVWMAHFWETYSFGEFGPYQDRSDDAYFEERVLDFINGIPIVAPLPPGLGLSRNPMFYEAPSGPSVDASLFQDEPIIHIMTPRKLDNVRTLEYPNKIAALVSTLENRIGFKVRVIGHPYQRLDSSSADFSILRRGRLGNAVFQYDPNYDNTGTGKKAFRLFYEGKLYFQKL